MIVSYFQWWRDRIPLLELPVWNAKSTRPRVYIVYTNVRTLFRSPLHGRPGQPCRHPWTFRFTYPLFACGKCFMEAIAEVQQINERPVFDRGLKKKDFTMGD